MSLLRLLELRAGVEGQLSWLPISVKLAVGLAGAAGFVWLAITTSRSYEVAFRFRIGKTTSESSKGPFHEWWPIVLLDASNFFPEGRAARHRLMVTLSTWVAVAILDVALLALFLG